MCPSVPRGFRRRKCFRIRTRARRASCPPLSATDAPRSSCFCCLLAQPADHARVVPALPPLSQARQHVGNPLHHHSDFPAPSSAPSAPSREPSVTRGRAPTVSSQRGRSSRSQTPVVAISRERPSPDAGVERKLERKPSQSYGHHRNTSIVHGIQHSRNTSFVNSPATSPLSPQIIAAAGGTNGLDGPFMMPQDELAELPANISPSGSNGGARYGTGPPSVSGDYRSYNEQQYRGEPRRLERTDSLRIKQPHVRSQSRHHHGRTVGELALHHLFNAVRANRVWCLTLLTLRIVCWTGGPEDKSMRH